MDHVVVLSSLDADVDSPFCYAVTNGLTVFDAQQIDLNPDDLDLPHNELRSAEFTPPGCLGSRVAAGMTVRLKAAIDAAATGTVSYLER